MYRNFALLFVILFMLSTGCTTTPTKDIKVDAQADPNANFGSYKTYAWFGAAAIVNDPYGQWEPPAFDADAEIKHLIDRELLSAGLTEGKSSLERDVFPLDTVGIAGAAPLLVVHGDELRDARQLRREGEALGEDCRVSSRKRLLARCALGNR